MLGLRRSTPSVLGSSDTNWIHFFMNRRLLVGVRKKHFESIRIWSLMYEFFRFVR
jgi:hypothetical protein